MFWSLEAFFYIYIMSQKSYLIADDVRFQILFWHWYVAESFVMVLKRKFLFGTLDKIIYVKDNIIITWKSWSKLSKVWNRDRYGYFLIWVYTSKHFSVYIYNTTKPTCKLLLTHQIHSILTFDMNFMPTGWRLLQTSTLVSKSLYGYNCNVYTWYFTYLRVAFSM